VMATFGYTLMCEQLGPKELVRYGVEAERAGFDFTVISDHFHPWLDEQGQSPFAWSVLGAVASQTSRMALMTMVTCPTVRYHPAIVAQMAATIGLMSDDRFTLGLGAGENLNEHVVGQGWPPANIRHLMLEEAIHVIRELWKGGYVSHQGDYFDVHDARIFSMPKQLPPIAVAAPCGPNVNRHLEGIQKYLDAGFDRIAILQAGRDQDGFFGFWNEELKPRLGQMGLAAGRQEAAAPAAGRSSR